MSGYMSFFFGMSKIVGDFMASLNLRLLLSLAINKILNRLKLHNSAHILKSFRNVMALFVVL